MELSVADLQQRWNLSWEAWNYEVSKFALTEKWYRAYEKHIRMGETWNESYRFPELFGAIQRKYRDLSEFLPEVKVKGDGDGITALQASFDHQVRVSNLEREKKRAIKDAIKTGLGCLFVAPGVHKKKIREGGKLMDRVMYDGLIAERVDPRDVIPAYSALVLHDHTGQAHCPFLFRRKIYLESTFKQKYADPKFDIKGVVATSSYQGAFSGDRTLTEREGIEKESGGYVTVLEYWDQEHDIFRVYANNFDTVIYDSPDGIPYSHKQLPFHFYYNYRREDSIAGVGEVELRMSYNLFREQLLNLMIDNAKLELQPAYVIDGDVNFNSEEAELEPGAIFTVRGLDGGKLQDSIMPFRAGGITSDIPNVLSTIEDSMITVTGDDTRSLYANPNQLATQTLAKREALQKSIRNNVMDNTSDTEFYLANQIVSYLKNELAKPYKDRENKTVFRKIQIEGFDVSQDKKESGVAFDRSDNSEGTFYLNSKVAEMFEDYEIEIISAKLDEQIKRDRMEKLMLYVQQIMSTAQADPTILQGFNIGEFLKQVSKDLGLDTAQIFSRKGGGTKSDRLKLEYNLIALGEVPRIDPEFYDLETTLARHQELMEYEQSALFKKMNKKSKEALNKFKINLLMHVQEIARNGGEIPQAAAPSGVAGGMANAAPTGNQGTVQGLAQLVGRQEEEGGAPLSPRSFSRKLRAGEGIRPT